MDGVTISFVVAGTVVIGLIAPALSSWRARHGPLGKPKAGDNWARGRLHSGDEWIGALPAWLILPVALLAGLAFFRFEAHDSRVSAGVLSLVVAAGSAKAIYLLLIRMKHGVSTLQAAPFPIGLNEELTGELITPLREIPQEGVRLRLQCIHEYVGHDVGDAFRRNRRRIVRKVLFETTERVMPNLVQARDGRVHVPFALSFGSDVPPTSGAEISWTLEASADIPGLDYVATFRLPVVENRSRDRWTAQATTAAPTRHLR